MSNTNLSIMCRFDFSYVPNCTIRTFNKEIYEVRTGLMVKNLHTNNFRKIEEIYYNIRTVRDKNGKVIAKRKNPNQELYVVSN